MFYPEKNKRYVRIRKNHRNYQEEMTRKRKVKNLIVAVALLMAVVAAVALGLPQWAAGRAMNFFVAKQEAKPVEPEPVEEPVEPDPVEEPVVEESGPSTVIFAGDVELSQVAAGRYDEAGIEGVVSEAMLKEIQDADLFAVNHEFCISDRGTPADKQYTFRVAPGYVKVLTDMGVDIAGLGNNHSLDYGPDALMDTIDLLKQADIRASGGGQSMDEAAELIVEEKGGEKFGFLICSHIIPYTSWDVRNVQPGLFTCYDPAELLARVREARDKCDHLFVMLHWGLEKTTSLESYQNGLANSLIDAGADAVIGAHPHVLQRIEYHNGKPIFYSLGNFVFGEETPETVILKVESEGGLRYQLLPAYAAEAKTYLASESEEEGRPQAILDTLRNLSPNVDISPEGYLQER